MQFLTTIIILLYSTSTFVLGLGLGINIFTQIIMNSLNSTISPVINLANGKCRDDLFCLYNDFIKRKMWALQMIDATAKPSSGLLEGNLINYGDFDQCLSIDYTFKSKIPYSMNYKRQITNATINSKQNIKGKYCLGSLTFTKSAYKSNLSMIQKLISGIQWNNTTKKNLLGAIEKYSAWGICMPTSCNRSNMAAILSYFKQLDSFLTLDFKDELCITAELKPLESKQKYGLIFFLIILQIIIMSTLYDYYFIILRPPRIKDKSSQTISFVLSSFSILKNASNLFTMRTPHKNQIKCLEGLKVLSMFWIVMGHSFLFVSATCTNWLKIDKWSQQLQSNFVQAAYFSVETFLTVSGILSGYICCQSRNIHNFRLRYIPIMYLHRFLRIAPAFYAMVIFYNTLSERIGLGPHKLLLNYVDVKHCWDKLPADVLLIQNYYKTTIDCIGTNHTWYLANEMQLCLLLPFLIILLKVQEKYFKTVVAILLIGSTFSVFLAIYCKEIPVSLEELIINNKFVEYHQYYYYPLHTRMGSWFIGLLLGHWLTQRSYNQMQLQEQTIVFVWSIWLILIGMLFCSQGHMKISEWGLGTVALYQALSRPLFAVCICWVVFACTKGYAGIVDWFLSLKIFTFLNKINYSLYLMHQHVIIFHLGASRTTHYFDNKSILLNFTGYLLQSICLAVIWTLLFEMPIINLEKYFYTKERHHTKNVFIRLP